LAFFYIALVLQLHITTAPTLLLQLQANVDLQLIPRK
jgi:hypothetical protein